MQQEKMDLFHAQVPTQADEGVTAKLSKLCRTILGPF